MTEVSAGERGQQSPPMVTTGSGRRREGRMGPRWLYSLGGAPTAAVVEVAVEEIDPFYELYGDVPDRLADHWEDYHQIGLELAIDEEFNVHFAGLEGDVRHAMDPVRKPSRHKQRSHLEQSDKAALIELFCAAGRAEAAVTSYGGTKASTMYGSDITQTVRGIAETVYERRSLRAGLLNVGVATTQLFEPPAERTFGEHFWGVHRMLMTARSSAKEVGKAIGKNTAKILGTTDEILSHGVEGAVWVVETVLTQDHDLRGKQMVADQLLSEYAFGADNSRVGRAFAMLKEGPNDFYMDRFSAWMLEREDGTHDFYRRIMGLDKASYTRRLQDHFDDFPLSLRDQYERFIQKEVSSQIARVQGMTRSQRIDYGPVDVVDALEQARRLHKKIWGEEVKLHPDVQTPSSANSRTRQSTQPRMRGVPRVDARTAELMHFEERPVVVGVRTDNGGYVVAPSIEPRLKRWLGGRKRDEAMVQFCRDVLKDVAGSRLFKFGVQPFSSINIRFAESDANELPVYSIDLGRYSGVSAPRRVNGMRMVFALSPAEEVVLLGVFSNHADYTAALRDM